MSAGKSKGPLQVRTLSVQEMNTVLQRIREELDQLWGLRGAVTVNDRVKASAPTESSDMVRLDKGMTLNTEQTVTAKKTHHAVPLRYVDGDGVLIHAIGTKD